MLSLLKLLESVNVTDFFLGVEFEVLCPPICIITSRGLRTWSLFARVSHIPLYAGFTNTPHLGVRGLLREREVIRQQSTSSLILLTTPQRVLCNNTETNCRVVGWNERSLRVLFSLLY